MRKDCFRIEEVIFFSAFKEIYCTRYKLMDVEKGDKTTPKMDKKWIVGWQEHSPNEVRVTRGLFSLSDQVLVILRCQEH